jgi:AmmeMemoRadiSam system protein A
MSDATPNPEYSPDERETLLRLARDSVAYGLKHAGVMRVDLAAFPQKLQAHRATFVTLHLDGALQGCIGTLKAHEPLVEGIVKHAFAAAFEDPRGRTMTESDLERLHIHISVLSLPEPLTFTSEADAVAQLRPGIDGVIIEEGYQAGTLLPSVWSSLTDRRAFFNHVKLKAGLDEDYWSPTLAVKRYTTESFGVE